jgi:large subunit ribosomal protein L20
MTKRKLVKTAKEAFLHAGIYAYQGRRNKKSDARHLWIIRISESLKKMDMSYSNFIQKLKKANIKINRKMLAEMIRFDPEGYRQFVDKVAKI